MAETFIELKYHRLEFRCAAKTLFVDDDLPVLSMYFLLRRLERLILGPDDHSCQKLVWIAKSPETTWLGRGGKECWDTMLSSYTFFRS